MLFAITISQVEIELGNLKYSIPTAFNGHAAWKVARASVKKFDKERGRNLSFSKFKKTFIILSFIYLLFT